MRANRQKLSNFCVSALIDDGVLPKAEVGRQKPRIAVAKAKPALSAKVIAVKPTPKAATSGPSAVPSVSPEKLASEPERQNPPPQQPEQAAPTIDQETFEALRNRAPYFLAAKDLASMFAEDASPQPSLPPR